MSCNDFIHKIGPYVDGELPGGERDSVESHLHGCSECRRMAREFGELDRLARVEAPAVTAAEWSETLRGVIRRTRPEPSPFAVPPPNSRSARVPGWVLRAGAIAAIVVLGGLLAFRLLPFLSFSASDPDGGVIGSPVEPAAEDDRRSRHASGADRKPDELSASDRNEREPEKREKSSGRASEDL